MLKKGSIHLEHIKIINKTAPKYMKQKFIELKGEIDSFTIIVGDFNMPLSIMD